MDLSTLGQAAMKGASAGLTSFGQQMAAPQPWQQQPQPPAGAPGQPAQQTPGQQLGQGFVNWLKAQRAKGASDPNQVTPDWQGPQVQAAPTPDAGPGRYNPLP